MPGDTGPTVGVWFAVLAVIIFFYGLIQSIRWLWETNPLFLAVFVGLLLATIAGRNIFSFFDI